MCSFSVAGIERETGASGHLWIFFHGGVSGRVLSCMGTGEHAMCPAMVHGEEWEEKKAEHPCWEGREDTVCVLDKNLDQHFPVTGSVASWYRISFMVIGLANTHGSSLFMISGTLIPRVVWMSRWLVTLILLRAYGSLVFNVKMKLYLYPDKCCICLHCYTALLAVRSSWALRGNDWSVVPLHHCCG